MEIFTASIIAVALCHLIVLEKNPAMKFEWYSTLGPMAIVVFASVNNAKIVFMLALGLAIAYLMPKVMQSIK